MYIECEHNKFRFPTAIAFVTLLIIIWFIGIWDLFDIVKTSIFIDNIIMRQIQFDDIAPKHWLIRLYTTWHADFLKYYSNSSKSWASGNNNSNAINKIAQTSIFKQHRLTIACSIAWLYRDECWIWWHRIYNYIS